MALSFRERPTSTIRSNGRTLPPTSPSTAVSSSPTWRRRISTGVSIGRSSLRSKVSWSPEIPRALPHDPQTEEKIRHRVRRHGIAEPLLPNHQALVGEAAENPRQPLTVRQAEDGGRRQKRL